MKVEKFKFKDFKDIILTNIKDKKVLFHCSPTAGLTELKPHTSFAYKKGTQPCIFASYHLNSVLFYGSKKHKGDLDGQYGICNEKGETFFNEAYNNALKQVYKGEKCYIYIVDQKNSNFEEGQTSYCAEVVDGTGNNVKLLKCYEVDDIYELMLEFEKCNFIHLNYFENYTEEQYYNILEHQKKLIRFYSKYPGSSQYEFCKELYPDAVAEIENENIVSL